MIILFILFIANKLYPFCCLLLRNFYSLFCCTEQMDRTRSKASKFSSHCLFHIHSDPHAWMLYIALSRSQDFSNICILIGFPVNMKLFVLVHLCVFVCMYTCTCASVFEWILPVALYVGR